jgi:anti-sigma B factor antagonist
MNVDYRDEGRTAVLRPEGALTAAVVDERQTEWFSWFKEREEVKRIVVDLQAVDFIDSSGLGLLIALLKRAAQRDGDVKLAGLAKNVRMVFEITRTYKVFDIYDSVEEALRDDG